MLFDTFSPPTLRSAIEYELQNTDNAKMAAMIAIKNLKNDPAHYMQFGIMEKAKYIRKDPDGKGGFKYIYKEKKKREKKEEPAKQTDSKEFKAWFGDSKVVDKDGKPLVVYHGTGGDFAEFQSGKLGARGIGKDTHGFFFSPLKQVGETYAGSSGKIVSVYLSLKNPKYAKTYQEIGTLNKEKIEQAIKEGYDGYIFKPSKENLDSGYYKPYNEEYVAFFPTQIKSATGNRGTFDPKSADMTKAKPSSIFKKYFSYRKK